MADIPAAARRVLKATYVPVNVTVDRTTFTAGRAVQKYAYVRQLNLQPGETAAVLAAGSAPNAIVALAPTLTAFEGSPLVSQLPPTNAFASTAVTDLLAFGKGLAAVRGDRLKQVTSAPPATVSAAPAASGAVDAAALATHLLNTSIVATNALTQDTSATPIGMLNLERLEMIPAGIERGELIATIPLAPMEQTAVVQKEWSVTTKEFTSIVTDSLENYSETGVTENTELAQSTTSQNQHSNQSNVNATVSGSVNFATIAKASGSVTTGFTAQDQNSDSATQSTKHAVGTTKKASSRVKQEHKVTISTTTVTGTSETTTRNLQNPSPTDPMRIDYFSLLRKWHVGLYRYGLRLTYDIVIPEPGGTLRQAYKQIADLQAQASEDFGSYFNVPYSSITVANYMQLAAQFGAQVPAPPGPASTFTVGGPVSGLDESESWHFSQVSFTVPDGFWITDVYVNAKVGIGHGYSTHHFMVMGSGQSGYDKWDANNNGYSDDLTTPQYGNFMLHYTGAQTIDCFFQWADVADVKFTIQTEPTPQTMEAWVSSVWSALYNAAQSSFYAKQQAIQAQIQALQDRINGVDTLTLRREEHDEITKGVLRWLLGPGFDFMPAKVREAFVGPGGGNFANVDWGISSVGSELFPGTTVAQSAQEWALVSAYEQMVRFVNDAIDWDNILYFLYSYFWDVPLAWENIRNIQHPDSTRQAFLRAGSARVVLTVRKGWETDWVNFVEGGTFGGGGLPELHPYLTIAQEIEDYDNTNYPGIPPANPGGSPLPDDSTYVATASNDTVGPSAGPVTLTVISSDGFLVGYTAIIDSWDPNTYDPTTGTQAVQEQQRIVAVPDATHITVAGLTNAHDGSANAFPVLQAGESGLLIAEWFEYTPSSGTDIAVTSSLATIA